MKMHYETPELEHAIAPLEQRFQEEVQDSVGRESDSMELRWGQSPPKPNQEPKYLVSISDALDGTRAEMEFLPEELHNRMFLQYRMLKTLAALYSAKAHALRVQYLQNAQSLPTLEI